MIKESSRLIFRAMIWNLIQRVEIRRRASNVLCSGASRDMSMRMQREMNLKALSIAIDKQSDLTPTTTRAILKRCTI
jgi:hypothetical protein